ncbi:MAG: hypothetical protein ACLQBK_27540 [Candidatus Sulfotelmatobacter sp.]
MTSPPEKSPSHWKTLLLLGSVTFFSFIYFYEAGGWNQNSRFDLLRAIVERHTLRTDAYYQNTEDRALVAGHYYSDKAPGLVFLAVPFALAARPAMRTVGIDPESARGALALSYLASAGASALPAALAAICLFFLGLRFGASSTGAAFAALAMALGTPFWAYASLFWAHALAGACLIFAFASALKLRQSQNPGGDFLWALAVGLTAGWATVTEYPALPASALLAFLALSQAWPRGKAARWRVLLGVGAGAAICLIVLSSYLHAVFGSFTPGYAYLDSRQFTFMQQRGYLGLTYPHPDRLLKLLFGCSRGLFVASPVMLAAPLGLWWLAKERAHRAPALVAAAIASYYFLFNASFYWWKSGLSFGPRYAGASLPFLCIGLAVAWQRATPAWRRVLMAFALGSIFVALMAVSTTSQLSMQDSCPLLHSTWPAFWSGQLAQNRVSMLTVAEAGSSPQYGAFNLGQLLCLHGLASLIPLLAVWGFAAVLWLRMNRQDG